MNNSEKFGEKKNIKETENSLECNMNSKETTKEIKDDIIEIDIDETYAEYEKHKSSTSLRNLELTAFDRNEIATMLETLIDEVDKRKHSEVKTILKEINDKLKDEINEDEMDTEHIGLKCTTPSLHSKLNIDNRNENAFKHESVRYELDNIKHSGIETALSEVNNYFSRCARLLIKNDKHERQDLKSCMNGVEIPISKQISSENSFQSSNKMPSNLKTAESKKPLKDDNSESTNKNSKLKISKNKTISTTKMRNANRKNITPKVTDSIMRVESAENQNKMTSFRSASKNSKLRIRGVGSLFLDKNIDLSSDEYAVSIVWLGKKDPNEKKVLTRFELATLINEERGRQFKKEGLQLPNMTYQEWRKKQDSRSDEEKAAEEAKKKRDDVKMAHYVTRITIKLLKLLESNTIDEKFIKNIFEKFLNRDVSSTSLLFTPHFIHGVMFCRGIKDFSRELRSLADECYQKCHAMFPLLPGCDFEAVYASEVMEFIPDSLKELEHIPYDYEDLSDSESEASEESDNSCFS